jgi:hypothetical protein
MARARELDRTAGVAGINAFGPGGVATNAAMRRHFLGEGLTEVAG